MVSVLVAAVHRPSDDTLHVLDVGSSTSAIRLFHVALGPLVHLKRLLAGDGQLLIHRIRHGQRDRRHSLRDRMQLLLVVEGGLTGGDVEAVITCGMSAWPNFAL